MLAHWLDLRTRLALGVALALGNIVGANEEEQNIAARRRLIVSALPPSVGKCSHLEYLARDHYCAIKVMDATHTSLCIRHRFRFVLFGTVPPVGLLPDPVYGKSGKRS